MALLLEKGLKGVKDTMMEVVGECVMYWTGKLLAVICVTKIYSVLRCLKSYRSHILDTSLGNSHDNFGVLLSMHG